MKTVTYELIIAIPLTVIANVEGSDSAESFSPSYLAEWMLNTAKEHRERGEEVIFKIDLP